MDVTGISPESIFSILGLVAGLASLIFLVTTFQKGPEALRGGIYQLIIGVSLINLAFLWDIVFRLAPLNYIFPFDLHHLFMASSILFFANAARKLYRFGR